MSEVIDNEVTIDDKTIMRRLGLTVIAMCVGALGIVALAITVGNLH